MKKFKGKAIYQPSGKAAEYAKWACNFYVGCSNMCEYCYCKKGVLKTTMGYDKPRLKACFIDENHAIDAFCNELELNSDELRKHGLFFSFSTDPMLHETFALTFFAAIHAIRRGIRVKILTKRTDWVPTLFDMDIENSHSRLFKTWKDDIAFGFTLTGYNKLEPNANTNEERILAMEQLHNAGFKTFASIEPVIDISKSLLMIRKTIEFCDLYMVGLLSSAKCDFFLARKLIDGALELITYPESRAKIYFKDNVIKAAKMEREHLPIILCVTRDYDIFTNKTIEP